MLAGMHQYIAGERRTGSTGERFDVLDPGTDEVVESVVLAGTDDVDAAVDAATAAYADWSRATPAERSAVLLKAAALLDERTEELAQLESRQAGKPIRLAREFDVPGTVDNTAFFGAAARRLDGMATGEYSADHTSTIRREPIGVVGSIAPWNYPLQMAAWKVLPAIAAGNTIVLKPAEITPLTSLPFAEAFTEAGAPPRGRQRRHRHRAGRRRAPRRPPRCRDDVVHRLDRRRPPGHGHGRGHRQARPPRARGQGAVRRVR
ncbi:hypothetical protein PDTK01_09860 [Phycicoccus sp. DTK01]|nr:hypothetical protein PDTK01_09860 [Phycicoccus sp. DTK01]